MATFIDIPIKGDKSHGHTPKDQLPKEELAVAFLKVFEFPIVREVRWAQYTPYFNDGEPCVFSVHGVYFRFEDTADDDGEYEDGFVAEYDDGYAKHIGSSRWSVSEKRYVTTPGPDAALTSAIKNLEAALEGGHHTTTLIELFGDHAQVTATREAFEIDYYEHD